MTAAVERMKRHDERFDLIIVDPPSFSRSSGGTFSGGRDYADLVAMLLSRLTPDGLLLAVSNMVKLPEDEFARGVGRGGVVTGRPLRVVRRFPLPPDFPYPPAFNEGGYLKAYLCQG
jgi:23S rRNA (cytosine1962-C5)-methyltransferase